MMEVMDGSMKHSSELLLVSVRMHVMLIDSVSIGSATIKVNNTWTEELQVRNIEICNDAELTLLQRQE